MPLCHLRITCAWPILHRGPKCILIGARILVRWNFFFGINFETNKCSQTSKAPSKMNKESTLHNLSWNPFLNQNLFFQIEIVSRIQVYSYEHSASSTVALHSESLNSASQLFNKSLRGKKAYFDRLMSERQTDHLGISWGDLECPDGQ